MCYNIGTCVLIEAFTNAARVPEQKGWPDLIDASKHCRPLQRNPWRLFETGRTKEFSTTPDNYLRQSNARAAGSSERRQYEQWTWAITGTRWTSTNGYFCLVNFTAPFLPSLEPSSYVLGGMAFTDFERWYRIKGIGGSQNAELGLLIRRLHLVSKRSALKYTRQPVEWPFLRTFGGRR